MPLTKSKSKEAFKSNLKAEIKAGKPKDQALAIAYRIQREAKKANGGGLSPPWFMRNEARTMTGPLHSVVAGRTDHLPITVPAGAYVIPAQAVSHLGQNNTAAGLAKLDSMFGSSGPYGVSAPKMPGAMKPPRMGSPRLGPPRLRKFADGGSAPTGEPVPIMAAGGEYVIDPSVVQNIGGGDIDFGHEVLDRWVENIRKQHIKTLSKLPKPAKD